MNDDALDLLTKREVECLALVAQGMQSKEIAGVLSITPNAVDQTLKRATARVGLSDRRQLARRLATAKPDLYQRTYQRLVQPQNSVVFPPICLPNPLAEAERRSEDVTPIRRWGELPIVKKHLLAAAIAIGGLLLLSLLVPLSRSLLLRLAH